MATSSAAVLTGWKEIAGYLGRGVRTVQRYEVLFGLPVRRTTKASVIAFPHELDRWLKDCSTDEVPHFEFDGVRVSQALESHRRAMRMLYQTLNSMMETVAKIKGIHSQALEEVREFQIQSPQPSSALPAIRQ